MTGPLADPRFRRLLAGQSLSSFGDTALYLMLGIWAKELTGSNSAAGGVFLALALPALFGPLSGHLADRVRRRPLLITTNAVAGVVVLSLLAVHGRGQLWILYAVAFAYGLASGILGSAGAGLRKTLLGDEQAASANALLQTVSQGLRVAAPLVGTGLFVAFGGGSVAILDSATFAAAIVALLTIDLDEPSPVDRSEQNGRQANRAGSFFADVTAGFRHIRSVRLLFQITIVTACGFTVMGLNETTIFAVVDQGLHRSPAFFGVLNSAQGAASVVGGIAVPMLLRRLGEARVVGLALAGFGVAALLYISHSVVLCLCASAGDGIGLVWLIVGLGTAAQVHTPSFLQGRVNAAWSMLVVTPQTCSIAAGTWLISLVDYRILLLVIVAVMAVCAAMLLVKPAAPPGLEPELEVEPEPESQQQPEHRQQPENAVPSTL